jgi:aminopeptidase N
MAWWDDVWLSESFATYMGFQVLSKATAFTGAWTDFALSHKPRGYDADQRASTHPVAPGPREVPDTDAARSAYDDISYAKGASVLRQLVAWTGWPAFITGINDYLARYRFASATLDDLLDCLARSSGADLREWAARWLRSPGVDTLTVPSSEAGILTHAGSRPHRVWLGVYDQAPGDAHGLVLRARVPVGVETVSGQVALPPAATDPLPALLLPNDGDFGYAKVRLDPRSRAALTSGLGRLPDPLSRAVAWNTARDLRPRPCGRVKSAWTAPSSPPRCTGCWPTSSTTSAAPCRSAPARPKLPLRLPVPLSPPPPAAGHAKVKKQTWVA